MYLILYFVERCHCLQVKSYTLDNFVLVFQLCLTNVMPRSLGKQNMLFEIKWNFRESTWLDRPGILEQHSNLIGCLLCLLVTEFQIHEVIFFLMSFSFIFFFFSVWILFLKLKNHVPLILILEDSWWAFMQICRLSQKGLGSEPQLFITFVGLWTWVI